jgi:hypothetical protein
MEAGRPEEQDKHLIATTQSQTVVTCIQETKKKV